MNFAQHEVRGPPLRRLLDVIMNQRAVAAYHGLVRISPQAGPRPMFPTDYPGDHEADVHWMASAARNGELRVVEDALVHKRFWPGMTSRVWTPGTRREARRLLVWHTARLTEFAWSLCGTDADRQQLIMAAWMRLWGLGLNWGVTNSGRVRPWSRRVLTRRLLQSLSGPSAQFARSRNFSAMLKQISLDEGVVGASRLARRAEIEANQGRVAMARRHFRRAIALDPLAGWAVPFREAFPIFGLLTTSPKSCVRYIE